MAAFATTSPEPARRAWGVRESLRLMRSTVVYDTIEFARYPLNIVGLVTVPAVFFGIGYLYSILLDHVTFAATSGGTVPYSAFLLAGIAASLLGRFSDATADRIRAETSRGTIAAVFASPTPRWAYLLSVAVSEFVRMSILLACLVVLALALAGMWPAHALAFCAALALGAALQFGLGLAWCGLALRYKNTEGIGFALRYPSRLFTGIMIPVRALPGMLSVVSFCFPETWVVDLVRSSLLGLTPLVPPVAEWIVVIALTLASLAGGWLVFVHFERSARRKGLLEAY